MAVAKMIAAASLVALASTVYAQEYEPSMSFQEKVPMVKIAHATLAALAFGLFFPVGAIVMAVLPQPIATRVHLGSQIFGYILFIAAFGMGVWMARGLHVIDHYHPVIGILLFALVGVQMITGGIHHWAFPASRGRTPWAHAHLWWGRIIVTLGIIQIGLGLKFGASLYPADYQKDKKGWIAVSIIGGLIWLTYIGVAVRKELVAPKKVPVMDKGAAKKDDSAAHIDSPANSDVEKNGIQTNGTSTA